MRELAIFDLDGTLVEILINKQEYEDSRLLWAKRINDKTNFHAEVLKR